MGDFGLALEKIILHIDFDSFFASCEQQFDTKLRGKPVGVTAENGRTCIIAASRQAKRFGIKTGSRTYQAKKLCPSIIFVQASFEKYLKITRKFLEICKDYSPFVEAFSIDEVFMDITTTLHLWPSLEFVVSDIKNRIRKEIGEVITVSIGVSYNKILAKLASSLNKPDGFAIIEKGEVDAIYKKIDLIDVCGIGERVKRRLNLLGVNNLLQLRNFPRQRLINEFGNARAVWLGNIANGIDDSPVSCSDFENEAKSVGRQYCLPKNEYDQEKISKIIYELCEEIARQLRKINKKAKTVGLYLAGEITRHGQKTIERHINLGQDIFLVCMDLYKKWNWTGMVRRISVWSSNLINEESVCLSLFDDFKKEKIVKTVDKINEKFGSHTIRNGFLLHGPKLPTKPNGYTK